MPKTPIWHWDAPSFRAFFRRLDIACFETLVASYCVYNGVAAMFIHANRQTQAGVFNSAVWPHLAVAFNIGFIIAGLLLLVGMGMGRREIEGAGLVTILTSVGVRALTMVWLIGFSPITISVLVLNGGTIIACHRRLLALKRGTVLLGVTPQDE